jgi:hypothetical protein
MIKQKGVLMQTIQFRVNDNYLQIILSLLQNLKQGIIEDLSVVRNSPKDGFVKKKTDEIDIFFDKFQIDMSDYRFDRDEANAR